MRALIFDEKAHSQKLSRWKSVCDKYKRAAWRSVQHDGRLKAAAAR
jgi:hypothetical protein